MIEESYQPHNILISRVSAIGDVLMTSPVARALREKYPEAHIAWLVEPMSAPIVRANPYVDEVIELPTRPRWDKLIAQRKFLTLWREAREFFRMVRAKKFDLTIDCHGLMKSSLTCRLSGAKRRLGFYPVREFGALLNSESSPLPKYPRTLSEKFLSVLAPLGIPSTGWKLILRVPEDDRRAAKRFLAENGITGEPYIACCVKSSHFVKDWVWERWGELADEVWKRYGARTVFVAGPECREYAAALAEKHPESRPISVAGHTSLLQSAALVQDAACVVGLDTGLTYAGLATDTPTVAMFGSGITPENCLEDEPAVTLLIQKLPCYPCKSKPTCANVDCMRALTVERVCEAIYQALHTRGQLGRLGIQTRD